MEELAHELAPYSEGRAVPFWNDLATLRKPLR